MHNLTGQSLGRYHILEPLGEGGMATVYKALDTRLENEVAVKVIRTERFTPEVLERSLKRFEREAKALARLTHANIVKVIDYGEHESSPYLVMPYLPGGTLKQLIRKRGRLPWREALRILLPIARALDYTHRLNVIHRDVKPSNILITESGDPLLTDFGVAKIIEEELTFDLTATSATVGTPEYMAPEQASSKHVDHRADLYSLGVVLYEMLTGRRPYEGDTPLAVIIKHASEPLPRPTLFNPEIPEKIEYILLKALAKKPEDRYADMAAFAEALEGALGGAVQPDPDTGRPDRPKFQPGSLVRLGLAVGGVLLVSALGYWGWQALAALPAVPEAQPVPATLATQTVSDDMVLIPAGPFLMGTRDGDEDEQPVHEVTLDAYWIDRDEVTNGEYKVCVEAGICDPPLQDKSRSMIGYFSDSRYADYPMIYVDWDMARAFCEWRGARLPTESEWEKAARGTDQRLFPWGETFGCDQANTNGCSQDVIVTGSHSQGASPYGVLNMAGNVSEWTADYYGSYPATAQLNPTGPSQGGYRVVRGGSYTQSRWEVRTTKRSYVREDVSYFYLGFRCAQSQPSQTGALPGSGATSTVAAMETTALPASASSTAAIAAPADLEPYLIGARTLRVDELTNTARWQLWVPGAGTVSRGIFTLTGRRDYSSAAEMLRMFKGGEGVLLQFRLAPASDVEISFESGNWQTTSFRRFGIFLGSEPNLLIDQGTSSLEGSLTGNLRVQANTWTSLFLGISKDGQFIALAWDPEEPSRVLLAKEELGSGFSGKLWRLIVKLPEENMSLDLESATEIAMEGIK